MAWPPEVQATDQLYPQGALCLCLQRLGLKCRGFFWTLHVPDPASGSLTPELDSWPGFQILLPASSLDRVAGSLAPPLQLQELSTGSHQKVYGHYSKFRLLEA